MIDLAETNPTLWEEVFGTEDIRLCFTCGRCVAGCPASEGKPPLLIRSLVRKVLLGLEDSLLDDDTPWTCVSCTRCEEVCPMGVRPFEVGLAIRRWQCKNDETRLPMAFVDIYKRGYTQPVGENEELRVSLGLAAKPPVIGERPELQERFRQMLLGIPMIEANSYMFGS